MVIRVEMLAWRLFRKMRTNPKGKSEKQAIPIGGYRAVIAQRAENAAVTQRSIQIENCMTAIWNQRRIIAVFFVGHIQELIGRAISLGER